MGLSGNTVRSKASERLKGKKPLIMPGEGRMEPKALELEKAVLGAMMLEKEALTTVIDILKADSFYDDRHQKIYEAIYVLFNRTEPVDMLTVTAELKKTGELDFVGGPAYVAQLTNYIASANHAEYHARVVAQKFIQRELIRIGLEITDEAFEDSTDVFDLLDKASSKIYEVVETNVRKQYDKMSTLITQAIKQIETASKQSDGITGVPTGFTAMDRVTGGWQKSDLIIVAARPAMGKTAYTLTLARNAAVDFNMPVAVFSLEMSSLQLVNRLIASEAELDQTKLRKGQLQDYEFVQLNEKIKKLAKAPLFIDDTPGLSIFELRAKARRLKEQNNIELIVIDYLQLMTAGAENRGNREQEISLISRSLKGLAKELNVPIIALSQLSRAVETRAQGSKKPQLSDLRESGAIEQDADMVQFIYRPEYYGITEDEKGVSTRGVAEIIIAKHRNGSLEEVPLKFIGQFAKFVDMDYQFNGTSDIYATNVAMEPNDAFLAPAPGRVMQSKMNTDQAGNTDIVRGNPDLDIEEAF
jgi:replicative DNA helicase